MSIMSILVEETLEIIRDQMDINEPEMVLPEYVKTISALEFDTIVYNTPVMLQYIREGRGRFSRKSEIVWKCLDIIRNDHFK